MNNLQILEKIINGVEQELCDLPFKFLNERALVDAIYSKLLEKYPQKINIESKTVEKITSKCGRKPGARVHMDVTTEAIHKKYKGRKVDILLTNEEGVELLEHSYQEGIPSTRFRNDDVLLAIEVKFYRGFPDKNGRKKLRKSEKDNLDKTIEKLKCIKKNNKKASAALVIFSNAPIRKFQYKNKRYNIRKKAEKNKIKYFQCSETQD